MGTTLLIVSTALIILVSCFIYLHINEPISMIGNIIISIMISITSALVLMVLLAFIGLLFNSEYHVHKTDKILALKDNGATEGEFFLGIGSIDESKKYFYMKETKLGSKMDYVDFDSAYVKEEDIDKTKSKALQLKQKFTNEKVRWFFGDYKAFSGIEYQFIVPKNTVTNEFKVDLE